MAVSGKISRIFEFYNICRPIILVLFFASLIVFINSYPNVPEIADNTKDYRQQVKNKINNDLDAEDIIIIQPEAPSLPNTIAPVISPEEVDEIVNPKPSPAPKPGPANETNGTMPETTTERKEPPLEIKLLTGFLNVAPLILIAAIGGFGIYLLFKYRKHVTLRSMFGVAIALVAVCTIVFFGAITFNFVEFLYDISFNFDLIFIVIILFAIPIGLLISYNIISKRTTIFKRNMGIAISGALMGAFLAAFLPFWIVFILLIAIALFDMYSVKYGPLKKILDLEEETMKKGRGKKVEKRVIYRTLENNPNKNKHINKNNHITKHQKPNNAKIEMNSEEVDLLENDSSNSIPSTQEAKEPTKSLKKEKSEQLRDFKNKQKDDAEEFDLMLMFDNPEWSLGLGDFVIYSMFTSAVLTYCLLYLPYYIFYSPALGIILSWAIFLICAIGLLFGFYITLKLLQKHDYLPGLPITIACGFIIFIFCIIILQLINYILFNEFAIII